MRQVKARLLKYNELFKDDDSDEQVQKPPNLPPSLPPSAKLGMPKPPTTTATSTGKKRQSKWGKVSTNESQMISNDSENVQQRSQATDQNLKI